MAKPFSLTDTDKSKHNTHFSRKLTSVVTTVGILKNEQRDVWYRKSILTVTDTSLGTEPTDISVKGKWQKMAKEVNRTSQTEQGGSVEKCLGRATQVASVSVRATNSRIDSVK